MTPNFEAEITVPKTIKTLCLYPVTVGGKSYVLFVAIDPDKTRQYHMTQTGSSDDMKYRIKLKQNPKHPKWQAVRSFLTKHYRPILFALFVLLLGLS